VPPDMGPSGQADLKALGVNLSAERGVRNAEWAGVPECNSLKFA